MAHSSKKPSAETPAFDPVNVCFDDLLNLRHQVDLLRKPRRKIKSRVTGSYHSRYKGRGMEFEEVRPYVAGDDIRSLDWKVTARTNEPYTKLYREERERPVQICVDMRLTMFFATRVCFKSVWVARAAALLSWKTCNLKDRVGGVVFNDYQHQEFKPKLGSRAVLAFLKGLSNYGNYASIAAAHDARASAINARSQTGQQAVTPLPVDADMFYQALVNLRRVTRPGSRVLILSDFRGLGKRHESLLLQLSRHNDVTLFCISDPVERELPESGVYTVSDGVGELIFQARNQVFRKNYAQQFENRLNTLEQISRFPNINLIDCQTLTSPLNCVSQSLMRR